MGGYRVVDVTTGAVLAVYASMDLAAARMRRERARGVACEVRTWTWGAAVMAVGPL